MKKPATKEPSPTKPSSDNGDEVDPGAHARFFEIAEPLPGNDSDTHWGATVCDGVSFGEVCENAAGMNKRANTISERAAFMRFSENGKSFSCEVAVFNVWRRSDFCLYTFFLSSIDEFMYSASGGREGGTLSNH